MDYFDVVAPTVFPDHELRVFLELWETNGSLWVQGMELLDGFEGVARMLSIYLISFRWGEEGLVGLEDFPFLVTMGHENRRSFLSLPNQSRNRLPICTPSVSIFHDSIPLRISLTENPPLPDPVPLP